MYINISEIAKDSGASLTFNVEMPKEQLPKIDDTASFDSSVSVEGMVMNAGAYFLLDGKAEATFKMICGKCLEAYTQPFQCKFQVRIAEDALNDEWEYYPLTNNVINIGEIASEQIYLQLPIERRCKPDCQGLCIQCGKNLNYESCSCNPEQEEIEEPKNNPFFKLKNMFNEEV